ncbi:MAG: hypothetical protein P8M60_02140 [Flavobacteriaceae bacterium]|jgi:hypothetical protein|nr:hypothetical protein [Flavobacteriaceae bacterium]MDB4773476.1 hypothetical protein [Flavobacteriaceae bacterium]MDG2491543.1 hypothetical protein [Flavobacteriaceae bacterium]
MKKLLPYFILLFLMGSFDLEAQCSMCRAVLESEEGQQTAKGINNGIVYLMAIPYILVAAVGYSVFKILKK